MFVIIMAKSINLTSFDIDTLKSIIFKKKCWFFSMNHWIRQFQAKKITLWRERHGKWHLQHKEFFFGKYTMFYLGLATTVSPRRSFSSLIKQRLACLIQQSSKLIISIINFLPTGICISGWWQLGASPLHSQVTLLAKKSGTNVKKAKLHTDLSDMIWNWGSKGVPVQARLERRGQKSFQRYKYTGGGLIKCVWPLSLLCLLHL